jgi:pilus assembly protein CpaF
VTLGFETILPFLRPIEHLIRDDSASEIMVNGSNHVFIEREGVLEETPDLTLTEKSLMVAVKSIARRLGDDIPEAKPILDSRLPDGSRVAAVIPPCSIHGVTLTIRQYNSRHFTVEDLVRMGTLDSELATRLQGYVQNRQNLLISGGTGCGKTTLLNALGKFIADEDRILLIEDTSEIQLEKPNFVRFEARQAQPDLPAITIRDLLKASLRHRPDRIILGEIRAGRRSIYSNSSTPATPGRSQRFTRVPPLKPSRGSQAAFSRAELNCPIAQSKAISPIP